MLELPDSARPARRDETDELDAAEPYEPSAAEVDAYRCAAAALGALRRVAGGCDAGRAQRQQRVWQSEATRQALLRLAFGDDKGGAADFAAHDADTEVDVEDEEEWWRFFSRERASPPTRLALRDGACRVLALALEQQEPLALSMIEAPRSRVSLSLSRHAFLEERGSPRVVHVYISRRVLMKSRMTIKRVRSLEQSPFIARVCGI